MGVLALVALLAVGCGSGAVEGPGEDDQAGSDQTDGAAGGADNAGNDRDSDGSGDAGDGGGDTDRYSWSLPVGDITPDDPYFLYQALRGGCDAGEAAVDSDQYRSLTDEQRHVYDAAIAVCRGHVEQGRRLFAGAGHGGSRSICFIYAGVVSVLEQRPADTSGCPPNPDEGTTSATEADGSSTSTGSTPTTGDESTTSTGEGQSTVTQGTEVGDAGG